MAWSFRVLDEIAIADVAFEVVADAPSELCTAVAHALFETLADPKTVCRTWHRTIDLQHEQFPELLFAWLSEIVYWKDADGVVFCDASASTASDGGYWRLHGTLDGALIDSSQQDLRSDIKAVTKHLYDVRQEGAGWTATVVLDI